jgi:hypothetical protein
VASGGKIESIRVEHPVLGAAVSIFDNRRQALGSLIVYQAFALLGVLGVYIGGSDLAGGSALLGWAEVAGGLVVAIYSVRAVLIAARRLRHPTALVIGTDGFEYSGGNGPVGWDEVASISDPVPPPRVPKALRVHLQDPDDYVARHALSPVARVMLRISRYDLLLGRDTLMPVESVHVLMGKRLAEYRQTRHDGAAAPASGAPKRRRASLRH